MMDEVTLATKSYQLVRKDLGLEDELVFEDEKNAFDRLEKFLVDRVNHLLDHDFNGLLNVLYRIDISEQRVNELLSNSATNEIALNITRAIIEREKEKVITREQYRQQ